jgi:arylsulfatase
MPISAQALAELDAHGWELYHVAEDIAENHNVAGENRERLIGMIAAWYVEAGKYKVLPIDGSGLQRIAQERPQLVAARNRYTYHPDTQTVPWYAAVHVLNRPHSITADVEIPRGGAEGVLLCQGTGAGGFSLYVKDGKLRYAHNYVSRAIYKVVSGEPVPEGRHQLRFEFEPTGKPDIPKGKGTPGRGLLYFDGKLVGAAEIPVTTPLLFNPGGLTCGANPGLPVTPDYPSPFTFTGTIYDVTVDVSGDLIKDDEADLRRVMAKQ